jgi:hypothetical protein
MRFFMVTSSFDLRVLHLRRVLLCTARARRKALEAQENTGAFAFADAQRVARCREVTSPAGGNVVDGAAP